MEITIVIPIKAKSKKETSKFIQHIVKLANEVKDDKCQIVIADESSLDIYNYMNSNFMKFANITHFMPEDSVRTGSNDKLNGVYSALNNTTYDKILLIDDHYRITRNTLINVNKYFSQYDSFKAMPMFNKFPLSVLIDLCGMLVVNMLDYKKQYCGHIAFWKSKLDKVGFPSRDALFDELAIEQQFRKKGLHVGFVKEIALETTQNISIGKFFEQRVRYAYENIGLPFRFTFHASILPLLFVTSLFNLVQTINIVAILTILVIFAAFFGQVIYGRKVTPFYTFLVSPIWFWFYPFTTWIAIYKYFNGGVMFGGRKVQRAL